MRFGKGNRSPMPFLPNGQDPGARVTIVYYLNQARNSTSSVSSTTPDDEWTHQVITAAAFEVGALGRDRGRGSKRQPPTAARRD